MTGCAPASPCSKYRRRTPVDRRASPVRAVAATTFIISNLLRGRPSYFSITRGGRWNRDSGGRLPRDVEVVHDVVRQLLDLDGAEARVGQHLDGRLLAPH